MNRFIVSGFIVACALSGCAEVDIQPINPINVSDCKIKGARFYQPEPYLLVTAAQVDPNAQPPGGGSGAPGAGTPAPTPAKSPTLTMQIVWLPNFSKPYTINVAPGWGTVNGTFSLENGWNLTSVGAQMDSKIPETITAVTGLLAAAAKVAGPGGIPLPTLIEPGLYHIEIDKTSGVVTGLHKLPNP